MVIFMMMATIMMMTRKTWMNMIQNDDDCAGVDEDICADDGNNADPHISVSYRFKG